VTDWTDQLCELDPSALQPIFADSHPAALDSPRALWRKTQHEAEDKRHISRAKELITRLPAPDESLHYVWPGTFRHAAVIPAVLDLAGCSCQLAISTLGYDKRCGELLLAELDNGRIQHIDMTSSIYARAHYQALDKWLTAELAKRGSRHAAAKVHGKILAFQFTDGTALVVESSSNLRSCQMLEASVISGCPKLAKFHREWISQVLDQEGAR